MSTGQLAGDVRITLDPLVDRRRQQRQGQCRCRTDAQAVARLATQALRQASHPLQALGDLVHLTLQLQRFGRGLQLSAHAQEQREAQLLLCVLQHFGDRRLGNVQQLRGTADRAGLADSLENLDMAKAHGKSITFVYGSAIFIHFSPPVTWP
ncbi:hypothetical protein D3C79_726710 [compost metagenome]